MFEVDEISRTRNSSAGLTIIEAMFAFVIGLVIAGMIMVLYLRINENMFVGVTLAEINSDARSAMDRIVRDVRWGVQLEDVYESYATAENELIIRIPSIDTNGKFIPNTYDRVIYTLDEGERRLRRIVDPDPGGVSSRTSFDQAIANNISSFSLSSDGTVLGAGASNVTSVEVTIVVDKKPFIMSDKIVSETLVSKAELRNR